MKKDILKKALAIVLCLLTLCMGMPLPLFAQIATLQTQKDTAKDFNSFVASCTLEERILLMQALGGLDYDIKDKYFGTLKGLYSLGSYAKKKKDASASYPLKPETFNDVAPETVADAIAKGYLKSDIVSRENICKELKSKIHFSGVHWFYSVDNINYHEDVVQWVAGKHDVDKNQIKTLSTFDLERKIVEMYFAEIWDDLTEQQRQELLSKIERETNSVFSNKAAIAQMSGVAAIGALSGTVAFTGFAFYTTMSTVIATVTGWLGLTLPFVAYTSASSAVSALAGPPGWIIAGVLLAGSGVALCWPDSDSTTRFVMVLHSIKVSRVKSFNLEKDTNRQNNQYTLSNSSSYGQNYQYNQNRNGQNNLNIQMNPYKQNYQYNQNMYGQPYVQNYPNNMQQQFQFGMGNGYNAARNDAAALTRAAQQGNVEAMLNLGYCYYYGQGVTQSYPNAITCWTQAAKQGSLEAQYILGKCYYNGVAVSQNLSEAVRYFQMAANQGHTEAQSALGVCYYYGYGVTRNMYEARRWLGMAANKGDTIARQLMNTIRY